MVSVNEPSGLLVALNSAIAREMQVSIQYMLQHAIWTAKETGDSDKDTYIKQGKFVGSHSFLWLTGPTLRKIAITEMKHAEAIAERIVQLGGEPTTEPSLINMGRTPGEIIEIDKQQELRAIELYNKIINIANNENDDITENLFKKILSDEKSHLEIFSGLLENP
jgi:bacterioferritin